MVIGKYVDDFWRYCCTLKLYNGLKKGIFMKNLTDTEMIITGHVQRGLSNKAIAKIMNISYHTVKAHLENIYLKLNINNRVTLAVLYTREFE